MIYDVVMEGRGFLGNNGDYGGNMMGQNIHFSHELDCSHPADCFLLNYGAKDVGGIEEPATFGRSRPPHSLP